MDDRRFEDQEPVEIEAEVVAETEAALLVATDIGRVWIPKSAILPDSEVTSEGDDGMLVIPRWLAEDRGLA